MQSLIRVLFAFLFCVGIAAGAVVWLLDLTPAAWRRTERPVRSSEPQVGVRGGQQGLGPGADREQPAVFDIILETFEDGGYRAAKEHMAPIRDLGSLQELREAVRGRGPRGPQAPQSFRRPPRRRSALGLIDDTSETSDVPGAETPGTHSKGQIPMTIVTNGRSAHYPAKPRPKPATLHSRGSAEDLGYLLRRQGVLSGPLSGQIARVLHLVLSEDEVDQMVATALEPVTRRLGR